MDCYAWCFEKGVGVLHTLHFKPWLIYISNQIPLVECGLSAEVKKTTLSLKVKGEGPGCPKCFVNAGQIEFLRELAFKWAQTYLEHSNGSSRYKSNGIAAFKKQSSDEISISRSAEVNSDVTEETNDCTQYYCYNPAKLLALVCRACPVRRDSSHNNP